MEKIQKEKLQEVSLLDTKQLLIEAFNLEIPQEELQDDIPLFQNGLNLDSIDVLEIIVQIEKRYNVKIHPQQIQKEDFVNLQTLHQFINKQIAR